jgi:death-on-curing protein
MFGDTPEQDLEFIVLIHDQIIDESGGSKGFHDANLIKSALARPMQSAFGDDAYVDIFEKAAALLDSIANNHGFKDGNKRTAMAAAIYYLSLLGVNIEISNDEYEQFMLHVVNDKPEIKEIKSWLMQHSAESRLR